MSITVESLSFTYMPKTPYERKALCDVSLEIKDGEVFGIIGSTGSGKSTFIQHLNGLIKLQQGKIVCYDVDLTVKKPDFRLLRSHIGMVFQYPEYQLFEETVELDVAFGPKNQGKSSQEIQLLVREAIENVGLRYEEVASRSPFELSGGQKRRVAIAGILAMKPKTLILDEPTSGLDPVGKKEILQLIRQLKQRGVIETVVIISHDMDEISNFADRIAVFDDAHLLYVLPTAQLFSHSDRLMEVGLDVPLVARLKTALTQRGYYVPDNVIRTEDFVAFIAREYAHKGGGTC